MTGPLVTRPQQKVINVAEGHGWRAEWMHRLLILTKQANDRMYLAQVLFKNGRWDYALTFDRSMEHHRTLLRDPFSAAYGDESETQIVETRRDLFAHLGRIGGSLLEARP